MTRVFVLIAACAATFAHAQAQWPRQPLRIVVSVAPQSSTDILARLAAQSLSASLGQPVAVENRPGAGGAIGAREVKAAPADGHTLLATSVALVINGYLDPKAGYDPAQDFAGVALAGSTANVIAVNPSVLAASLKELFELAKREKLSYASSGVGTTTHLSIERLKALGGVEIAHLPRQPAQAVAAAVSGQVPISCTSLPPALAAIREGRLRPVAVTSAARSPRLPDVPTVAEFGYAGFDDVTWFGFFAPAATPAATVQRLNAAFNQALATPAARDRLAQLGLDHRPRSAPEFAKFLKEEAEKWSKAVKDSGARPE